MDGSWPLFDRLSRGRYAQYTKRIGSFDLGQAYVLYQITNCSSDLNITIDSNLNKFWGTFVGGLFLNETSPYFIRNDVIYFIQPRLGGRLP